MKISENYAFVWLFYLWLQSDNQKDENALQSVNRIHYVPEIVSNVVRDHMNIWIRQLFVGNPNVVGPGQNIGNPRYAHDHH